jgi:hypothetical protein
MTEIEAGKKYASGDDDSVFTDDPEKNMIVESYDPVIVTCHQDAMIRFWDAQVGLHAKREQTEAEQNDAENNTGSIQVEPLGRVLSF